MPEKNCTTCSLGGVNRQPAVCNNCITYTGKYGSWTPKNTGNKTVKKRSCETCVTDDIEACKTCQRPASGGYCNNWVGASKSTKNTLQQGVNPKDAIGSAKNPHGCVSAAVSAEVGLAMMEGARKYGRHNYRVSPVRAEVYYDACKRHVEAWWEGEDIDSDSGLHHLTKAIASLFVIRDAIIQGSWYDDRPPVTPPEHWEYIKKLTAEIIEKYPDCKPPFTEKEHKQKHIARCGLPSFCPECYKAILQAKDGETVAICEKCTNVTE